VNKNSAIAWLQLAFANSWSLNREHFHVKHHVFSLFTHFNSRLSKLADGPIALAYCCITAEVLDCTLCRERKRYTFYSKP